MPYIKEYRDDIANGVRLPQTAGELNFLLTTTILDEYNYCQKDYGNVFIEYTKTKGESYQTYNDIMGAVLGCIYELERRYNAEYLDEIAILTNAITDYYKIIGKYEDKKIKENGDVFPKEEKTSKTSQTGDFVL